MRSPSEHTLQRRVRTLGAFAALAVSVGVRVTRAEAREVQRPGRGGPQPGWSGEAERKPGRSRVSETGPLVR